MTAPILVTAFDAEQHALECRACNGSGQTREEDDGGSYGVACDDCAGNGDHRECSQCDDLATRRAHVEVDGITFDELACKHFECVGTAVNVLEGRVASYEAKKAARDAAVKAEVAANSCAHGDVVFACAKCEATRSVKAMCKAAANG